MLKRAVLAVIAIGTAATVARAACIPFGSDDAGCLASDPGKSKCQQNVVRRVSKLVHGLLRCQRRQVHALFRGNGFDDLACENIRIVKFVEKTDTTSCPCIDTFAIAVRAYTVLAEGNDAFYCDSGGTPIGIRTSGWVPTSRSVLVCEHNLVKCADKLVRGRFKCHRKTAKAFVTGQSFDEEACEATNVQAFNTCVGSLAGCLGCEDIAGIATEVDAQLDGGNDLIFCE